MRLYTFTNYYLSDIQRGIQTAHLVHELFTKYPATSEDPLHLLYDWAENHKTIVVLNGGNSQSLSEIYTTLAELCGSTIPFTFFNEDDQSLNGALTCVGVVVPTKIIDYNDSMKGTVPTNIREIVATDFGLSNADVQLAELVKRYPLA